MQKSSHEKLHAPSSTASAPSEVCMTPPANIPDWVCPCALTLSDKTKNREKQTELTTAGKEDEVLCLRRPA